MYPKSPATLHSQPYCGRFAPTPSGSLHFGSLIAALGSYLDAKAAGGQWLLRIEDVDKPRVAKGAIDQILRQLDAFALEWDGPVMYQSQRYDAYRAALQSLQENAWIYPCNCTRSQIYGKAIIGPEGPIYPGNCRAGLTNPGDTPAWRMRTSHEVVQCHDRILPTQPFDIAAELGDFVIQRADGIFGYQLAVVVDDAEQGITDVVRGADLWLSTPRQYWLQQALGLSVPRYLHLPLVLNATGEKLSKQTMAPAVWPDGKEDWIWQSLHFLGQSPPIELQGASSREQLNWGVAHWNPASIPVHGGQKQETPLG